MLFLTVISLLLVPGQASAQVDHPYRVEALVTGGTDPDPDEHSLGVNRVAGRSGFQAVQINAVIDCEGEIVVAQLEPTSGLTHTLPYETDDDITDGFGELDPTDGLRELESTQATEFRVPPGLGDPAPAAVRVRILEGRFHRILNVVEVDLRLDIRVVRNPGTGDQELVCETGDTDDTRIPEVRINLLIVGPDPDGEGFQLVGEARRHGDLPDDRRSLARTVCGAVGPHSTRVTEPPVLTTMGTTPISPGRDAFHPCPPAGQN